MIIEQYSPTYTAPYKRKCISCRAVITDGTKILLSYESKTGFYTSAGGSLEEGETLEECVVRELMEETGYSVKPVKQLFTVNEYCYDTLYVSNYFLCEILGKGERALTPTEADKGVIPQWVELEKALEIFGDYSTKTPDKESLYRREFTVLSKI